MDLFKTILVQLGQSRDILVDPVTHLHNFLEFIQNLLRVVLFLGEYGSDPVQNLESAPGLHKLLLWILKAHPKEVAELLMYRLYNLGVIVFECDNFVWFAHLLAEARVVRALFVPNGFVSPPVDHGKPLHEEDAEVFRLVVGAAMDGRDDTHYNLSKNIQKVDLWHSQVHKNLDELDRVKSIRRREHESRVQTVLHKESTHVSLVLHSLAVVV